MCILSFYILLMLIKENNFNFFVLILLMIVAGMPYDVFYTIFRTPVIILEMSFKASITKIIVNNYHKFATITLC